MCCSSMYIHWADAASLDLLAYLVRRLRGQPLFILGDLAQR